MTEGVTRGHRVVVTAGHVDHGKSTLVRALTGMEPDRLAEEQRRGLTIDLGYGWFHLDDGPTIAFVDVPGHTRYVETMLAGVGAAPATMFVVAADDGWSAQSTEHRDILDLLEIPAVARVVTKAASVSAERLDEAVAELERQTAGTSLARAPIVVTDAVIGWGLDDLRRTLAVGLAALEPPRDRGRPRLWIDRSFALAGIGTVVTGTLLDGTLGTGGDALLLPSGREVRLRRLQALGRDVEEAGPGTRVAVNLPGIDPSAIDRGDVLASSGPWASTDQLDAVVRVAAAQQLDRRGAWKLHAGTATVTAQVRPLAGTISANAQGAVRLTLSRPLPLGAGDRFVLRETGRRVTVAGGVVADPAPQRPPQGRAARLEHEQHLLPIVDATEEERMSLLLALHGGLRSSDELRVAAGWNRDRPLPDGIVQVGDVLLSEDHRAVLVAVLRELPPGPLDRAIITEQLRRSRVPAPPAGALIDHLVRTGVVVRTPGGVSFPEHAATDIDAREQRRRAVLEALDEDPLAPPDLDELTRALGLDARERAALISSGAVVRCGKVAFSRAAIERATEQLRELQARAGPFTASAARETLGTSRRYALPLLEHLQRIGVTRFDGAVHQLREPDGRS
jgi:selenocysteine-specific elongation factor